MKKTRLTFLTIMIALFTAGLLSANEDAIGKSAQTTCPIMGGEINKEIYTDYKGNRVYFCCKSCIGEFNKNPDKYIHNLLKSGVTIEKTPISGNPKNSDNRNDAEGSPGSACSGCGGCS
jgi:YHS domain-containing protein